jgi:hypothetical protein
LSKKAKHPTPTPIPGQADRDRDGHNLYVPGTGTDSLSMWKGSSGRISNKKQHKDDEDDFGNTFQNVELYLKLPMQK